jgi:hypothetical protein
MLLALLLTCVPGHIQGSSPQEPIPATQPGKDGEKPLAERPLGAPIVFDGEPIPEQEVLRFLCLGLGRQQVETAKIGVIIETELTMRAASGEDISKYEVPRAKIAASLEKQRMDFLERYPSLDFPTEVGRAFLSLDLYREQLTQTLLFDLLFFPDNPDEWPPLTTEAIIQGTGNMDFVDDAKESYQYRYQQQLQEGLDEIPADDPIFTEYLRSMVLETLTDFSTIVTDPDSLPDGVLVTVDGTPVMIDDIFEKIKAHVSVDRFDDARLFVTLMHVTRKDLESSVCRACEGAGAECEACDGSGRVNEMMSEQEFAQAWAPGTPLSQVIKEQDMLARNVYGFPSIESYVYYLREQWSLRKRYKEQLADKELLGSYIEHLNKIAGAGKVDCEVILATSYDFPNNRWKEDGGWEYAEKKAAEIKKLLDEGADWKETLDLHSEFWDPPLPEKGQKPQFGYNFKGRFGPQTRNQLLTRFEESEFTWLLRRESISDRVFFEQEIGSVIGPFKGTRGYYISKLKSRTQPTSGLRLEEPRHVEFIVDHYMRREFMDYAHGLLDKAREEGRLTGI